MRIREAAGAWDQKFGSSRPPSPRIDGKGLTKQDTVTCKDGGS